VVLLQVLLLLLLLRCVVAVAAQHLAALDGCGAHQQQHQHRC
jgi:hypothetical protein